MIGGRASVLIVDDDDDLRSLLSSIVSMLDVEVRSAANGLAALALMDQETPDLILLDMRMPVMDGWEFCRALDHRDGVRPPIVVMTAAPNPEERSVEVGAQCWMGKPFDLDILLGVVRRFLPTMNPKIHRASS